ncbi:uncharacterized protein TRIADDRAFT_59966 [Trichoplax adhaerens]|uniref:Arrestin C-terminal-like domain-containing protein n=1 Tax=Trichoplax adhaerens TaxID=10228 RepID=B3S6X7_TRIAD|nr:hypothetical protein TRIADDRAFT_59966 [Trichoplax adhaerens]EDV21388.1 hypothetical protein TRIADDRAFT_59966 [Trichoplax adhaerens]|eukprot:XP_002115988.1 hypothetical protein TRIADDRAFT_59966 [Trichoplax adhaerens]
MKILIPIGNFADDQKPIRHDILTAGHHRFPFAFVLPEEGLPSSVKAGSTFTINYQISATIVFPHRPSYTVHQSFFIFEVVDVNLPRYVKSSKTDTKEIKISKLCCLHGSIRITASTNHVGFRPGEPVCMNVRVQNNSHKIIRYLRAKLIQIVEIKAKLKQFNRTIEHICSEKHSIKSIVQDEELIWEKEPLQIPSVPPTVNSCPAISINYAVEIQAVLPRKYHLVVRIPITIGTVRLFINTSASVTAYRSGVDTNCRLDGSESVKQQLKGTISDAVAFKDVELDFNERRQASL